MTDLNWLEELKKRVPSFLKKLTGSKPGFFNYSLTGDIYDENYLWGLGNCVFAVKILYTLNLLDSVRKINLQQYITFINKFKQKDGSFFDPLIKKKSKLRDKLMSLKNFDFNNFFHIQTIRAETRQAISSLKLLNTTPKIPSKYTPNNVESTAKYLNRLNWHQPWGASSHFSHLLFFIFNSDIKNKHSLIDYSISWINKIQNKYDGSWYKGSPPLYQKVNSAMKIITGLKLCNKIQFKYPEKIIDMCLTATNYAHACDNFNIIYPLHYSSMLLDNSYRFNEIKSFFLKRLEIYKKYYYSEIGGFSFKPNQANIFYYNAKITQGLDEPDIHGTVMFLWGISIISQTLGINKYLNFKEFTP